ncbi:MAG: DUF4238 domain-containing protein [Acidobacteria bacterium]|nr:DUF4238 domain-containing protein [Acidobacteriota bacterium]
MKKRTKGQHFVPSSYLRGFATGAGKGASICIYERNRLVPFRQRPQKAAVQTNYYSFKRQDGTLDDSAESFLARVESEAVPVIRTLASNNIQLNWDDRGRVAFFVALQELRVPWTRQNFEEVYAHLADHLMKFTARVPGLLENELEELKEKGEDFDPADAASIREFMERGEYTVHADPKVSLLTMLQMAPMLHRFYIEMKWTILRTSHEAPFVTSDNPVVMFDPAYKGGFWGVGLVNPTIEIRFPLTKTAMLVITHDHARFEEWHRLMEANNPVEAKTLRQTLPVIDVFDVQPRAVEALNALTIVCADRFVYAPKKDPKIPELLKGESRASKVHVGSLRAT